MSAPDNLSPNLGTPLRTSVPLATRTPARASISPSSIPPRLSAKLGATIPPPPLASPPVPRMPVSQPVNMAAEPDTGMSSSSGDSFLYREDLLSYALQAGLQAIPAIAIGLIIDKVLHKLQERFQLGPLVMIVIQLIVMIVILFIVEKYIAGQFAADWQFTTPGIFFFIFFFGVQFNLFENIKKLKKIVFDEK